MSVLQAAGGIRLWVSRALSAARIRARGVRRRRAVRRRAPGLDVGGEGGEHFLGGEQGAAHNEAVPVSCEEARVRYEDSRAQGSRPPSRPTPPASAPKSTSTQGSEPSCLTSTTTEHFKLVARTFSRLTAWRKVLRREGGVSAGPRRGGPGGREARPFSSLSLPLVPRRLHVVLEGAELNPNLLDRPES